MDRPVDEGARGNDSLVGSTFARIVTLAISLLTLLTSSPSQAQIATPHKLEVGASAGWIHRSARSGAMHNPAGMGYDAAFAQTVQLRVRLVSFLRIGAYYQRASHTLEIPTGALEPPGASIGLSSVLAYSIGGRLEPTLELTPRVRLWLILGAGWGRMTTPRMKVSTPTRSYTVMEREGVLVEIPMGLGGSFQLIPDWLAVTFDTTIAPNYAQSGSLHEPTQFVDNHGAIGHTVSVPEVGTTFAQMFGLSLIR